MSQPGPDPQALVEAWNKQYGRGGVAVLFTAHDNDNDPEIAFTHGMAFLTGKPEDQIRQPVVRIGDSMRCVPLSRVTVHPRHAEVANLPALKGGPDLDFPPPDCAYCEIDLEHDGDGWNCGQCHAWWPSNGNGSSHHRYCVEENCENYATTVGDDRQPRCTSCAFLILLGEISPTPPYRCRDCYGRELVVGMPTDSAPAQSKLCGRHSHHRESERRWADYQRRHGLTRTTTATATGGVL